MSADEETRAAIREAIDHLSLAWDAWLRAAGVCENEQHKRVIDRALIDTGNARRRFVDNWTGANIR